MMATYKLTREEQETIIRTSAADSTWDVCTADPKIKRRMERLGYHPNVRENPWGYVSYTIPFAKVSIRRPGKSKPRGNGFSRLANLRKKTDQNLKGTSGQGVSMGEVILSLEGDDR